MKAFVFLSIIVVAFASRQCGENQHFESCGTACPLTCDNYDNPPKFCILRCDIGCHCDAGYVKTNDGRCVKPEECHAKTEQVCGENERYYGCGTACPLTCDNYANPPKICPAMCVIGCQCEKGYVKTRDGRCVRPEDCPADARSDGKSSRSSVCSLPRKIGVCDALIPRFYFNSYSEKCEKFMYGGCGGNGNNFRTLEECERICG